MNIAWNSRKTLNLLQTEFYFEVTFSLKQLMISSQTSLHKIRLSPWCDHVTKQKDEQKRYDFKLADFATTSNWPINCGEKMVAAVAEIAHVSVFLFRDNIIFLILNSNNL